MTHLSGKKLDHNPEKKVSTFDQTLIQNSKSFSTKIYLPNPDLLLWSGFKPEDNLRSCPVDGFKTMIQSCSGKQSKPSQVIKGRVTSQWRYTISSSPSKCDPGRSLGRVPQSQWKAARIFQFFWRLICFSTTLLDSRTDFHCFERLLHLRIDFKGNRNMISSSRSGSISTELGFFSSSPIFYASLLGNEFPPDIFVIKRLSKKEKKKCC